MSDYVFKREKVVGDGPAVCFVGLAPLIAEDSHTMRRYARWAAAWGYGRVLAVNVHPLAVNAQCDGLDAWIASPEARASETNKAAVMDAAYNARSVIACWGAGDRTRSPARDALIASNLPLYCFGRNADGSPKHPSGRALPSIPEIAVWRCDACSGQTRIFSDGGPQHGARWIDCPICSNPLRPTPPIQTQHNAIRRAS